MEAGGGYLSGLYSGSVVRTQGGKGGNGDKQTKTISVTPGQAYTVVVGKGGTGGKSTGWYWNGAPKDHSVGYTTATSGQNGETSRFANSYSYGGTGGLVSYNPNVVNNGTNAGNGQGGQGGQGYYGGIYYDSGARLNNDSLMYTESGQDGWVTLTYNQPKAITQTITKPGTAGGQGGLTTKVISVTAGEKLQITVGKGGIAGVSKKNGGNGGNTAVQVKETNEKIIAQGGGGGIAPTATSNGVNGTSYGNGGAGGTAGKAGSNGYVKLNFTVNVYDNVINAKGTNDNSAIDRAAPEIRKLYIDGIIGDDTKYKIEKAAEDFGTTYEHYVVGNNETYNVINLKSNIVKTKVITGIQGYSWVIDKQPNTIPDSTVGYDNDSNKTKEFPETIVASYVNTGYYLHVKPVDNAGNWGQTKHISLTAATITLTSHYAEKADSRGYGPNYVPLTWENSDKRNKYYYRLFQNSESDPKWNQVSTKYGEKIKVLNVYPVGLTESFAATNTEVTFKSALDGKTYTIPKSASLKQWMEEANSEQPKGYGKGLISVDIVSIDDYNNNPDKYLKDSSGKYKYDVIMFGTWDSNARRDLNQKSVDATREFINTGRGVLYGHDTLIDQNTWGQYFNMLSDTVNIVVSRDIPWVGSTTVKVIKKGYLTKFPYNIETGNLTIPYSHTTGEYAYGDIWLRYLAPYSSHAPGPEQGENANNNYFITTWNNCAVTRTGHSNCAATPDEQKILANVLWYLGQVTEDTFAEARTGEDLAVPEIVNIQTVDNQKNNRYEFNIKGIDNGTDYEHYVSATQWYNPGTFYSNSVHTTVKTGIAKFQYTINTSETEYSGKEYEVIATDKENAKINISKTYKGQYIHIRPVDIAGNIGEVTTIQLDDKRQISREEKNETKTLYCVEEDVLIPAKYDGTQADATVTAGGRSELVSWPLEITKLFEIYKEGTGLNNPYGRNGQNGLADQSNSLGRYLPESTPGIKAGKKGNADEEMAYILSFYNDNNIENSESQKALYELLAERNKAKTQGTHRNEIYLTAKEYGKFRNIVQQKGGFVRKQISHEIQVGYSLQNKQYIIGPFEVDYIRNYSTINSNGKSKKIEFSGIGVARGINITNKNGIRLYDQNGKEISQGTWSIEYDNKAQKERTRSESYSEYAMPLPKEEFYIKLNRTGNENVTNISKIEVEYYEMEADAKYSILNGNYNNITWTAKDAKYTCPGGTMCPHGRTTAHVIGREYYISSKVAKANMHSQRLLELGWATRGYNSHVETLTLNVKKTPSPPEEPGDDDDDDD
ncbi:MAG: hypothetical protein IJ223_04320, partial [Clostridia bacterium]|nr:hypothetical protein [Clostridia bacterium]